MQRAFAAVALCAGCQASLGPGGGDTDAALGGVDSSAADGASVGDGDGDGHLDNLDNCPGRANADQHDEDGDSHGDLCDPCPHLAGSLVDGDGDGVGDACDPQPSIAKQRIKFFDPFTADLPEWQHSGGITRMADELRGLGPAFTSLSVSNGETRIATGGRIVSAATATPHQLSLAYGFNQAGDIYHYCEFYDTGGASGSVAITKANANTYTGLASASYSGVLPAGAWSMRIDESVAAQRISLEAKVGTTNASLTASTTTAPVLTTSNEITLFIRNADIRFGYFVVIETLP